MANGKEIKIERDTVCNYKIYVRGIIFDSDNRVLLIKKKSNQKIGGGEWLLPGGTLEFGENVEHTLIREIKEEVNLDVSELELLSSKKMIIGDTHWLGMYFICKVSNEKDLFNVELDKHEEIGFFKISDIPHGIKDYMILKTLGNFSKEYFDVFTSNQEEHSMKKYLSKYVENKVHTLIKDNLNRVKYVKVVGNYDRSSLVSKEEKNDKNLNYKRPTALIEDDCIYVSCFPGSDYIKHYANIISTYFNINGYKKPLVSYKLPSKSFTYNTFISNGLKALPNVDIILFGNIDKIGIFDNKDFIEEGDFMYKVGTINSKKVLLLGCKFSIWGNIGEYFIDSLSKNINFNTFIYIGKLGVLDKEIEPNKFLATGDSSYIDGKYEKWNNIFNGINHKNIIYGRHITCCSVIEESVDKILKLKGYGKFIDPEIGNMAKSCNNNGKKFSYLHIISDNVIIPFEENLSNERKEIIINKRKKLFTDIGKIIKEVI